ncbi:Rieske (2Fe-2S) protein [Dietzia sp.]|uniref:Rieske (2Fe-2S) protein n=1 Tax=Dietzia sp. TaxID=1871616 RepID=UPI002FD8A9EC
MRENPSSADSGAPADRPATGCGQSRRAVLAALPGVILLPGTLAACSGPMTNREPQSTAQATTTAPSTSIAAADIPVGTAKVVDAGGAGVVVAQPSEGEFVAFSASCTHQGARIKVADGMSLRCPLHGSQFDAATGKVTNPPAQRPLDVVPVAVQGDRLVLGA